MRPEERQGKVACGGLGFDGDGKRKKEAVSARVIALGEEEGFTQPVEHTRGKQTTLRSCKNSNKPFFIRQQCFSATDSSLY